MQFISLMTKFSSFLTALNIRKLSQRIFAQIYKTMSLKDIDKTKKNDFYDVNCASKSYRKNLTLSFAGKSKMKKYTLLNRRKD